MQTARIPSKASILYATRALNASFLPIGMATVLLGPLLPALSARWSLNYAQAGSLFTAQFMGSMIGTAISGALIARWGFRFGVKTGLLAAALGIGGLSSTSFSIALLSIASYGFGLGLAIPTGNLFIAHLQGSSRSAAVNRLNFWWSAGAVSAPFLVAAAVKANHLSLFLGLLSLSLLICVFPFASISKSDFVDIRTSRKNESAIVSRRNNWTILVALAALFFLYVGTENAFGGWIASYAKNSGVVLSSALATLTPSLFYAALAAGRWIGPVICRGIRDNAAARVSLALATLSIASLIFSRTLPLFLASVVAAGFGLAMVYPITICRLADDLGPAPAKVGPIMFMMANFGGASLPWLVGSVSNASANVRWGLAVPLIGCGLMLAFYALPKGNNGEVTLASTCPGSPSEHCRSLLVNADESQPGNEI